VHLRISNTYKLIAVVICQVVGWENTLNHEKAETLQKVSLKVESYEDCYIKDREFVGKRLKPGQNFCAAIKGDWTIFNLRQE